MGGEVSGVKNNFAAQTATTSTAVETGAEARGSRRGEGVVVQSATSKIADMAEEIGMSTAHRANKKDMGERVEKRGAATDFEALSRIIEHLDRLPDMPRDDKLRELVKKMNTYEQLAAGGEGGGMLTGEDILEMLREYDGDTTHQLAALDSMVKYLKAAGGSEQFLQMLATVREKTFETPEMRREVMAGLAAAEAASEAAKTLGVDPKTLRDEYRAAVQGTPSMATLFARLGPLVDQIPADKGGTRTDRERTVIETLLSAAARDLEQAEGTNEKTHIGLLITELGRLKQLRSVIDMVAESYDTIMDKYGDAAKDVTGVPSQSEFTARLVNFISKSTVTEAMAKELIAGFDDISEEAAVFAGNALRVVLSTVSDAMVPSAEARLQQKKSFMDMMTNLVVAEETAAAGGNKVAEPGADTATVSGTSNSVKPSAPPIDETWAEGMPQTGVSAQKDTAAADPNPKPSAPPMPATSAEGSDEGVIANTGTAGGSAGGTSGATTTYQ
ncbi:MAG: HrpJ domain-containing protein [Pseudomonadota bacterium]